ncbi:NADH-quinone oxidoreductase subunit C [Thermococcus aggregans]|uniref:NADH-quinone oxidoreductase subunit C n=1 Tax=Thermococcus aggregans TaxID=110163 RepID=A0A9E7MZ07_THEAG|nr:NADH-quinone oxidoreductase subunit C [Thermococcus aggregans]USS41331.1 NADH-quinone oxidoreductase subunit C [Thermococcus aggregans]
MTPEEFLNTVMEKFPDVEGEIRENKLPHPRKRVWLNVDRTKFKELMRLIKEIDPNAQLSIIIGRDGGDYLEAKYHLELFYEQAPSISLVVGTKCPKDDPTLPSIADILPSALPYEREVQEFLGIFYEGIPDPRRLFLPDDFPEGIYPLRKDEKGISESMVKNAGHPYKMKKEG